MTRLCDVLKTKPLTYQYAGIKRIHESGGRIIQGDDMGLGKTLQVLAWLAIAPYARPACIVTPANAKWCWEAEIRKHTKNMTCQVLEGKTPYPITNDIVIVNYEIVSCWRDALLRMRPKFVAFDEAHYIKNLKAKRTKTCLMLAQKAKYVIPMTGTPIVNTPIDLFPSLHAVDPATFSSFWKYAMRFCGPKKTPWRWEFKGVSNAEELWGLLQDRMIRRMKDDVLADLPAWQETHIIVDIDNYAEYARAEQDFIQWYTDNCGNEKARRAMRSQALVKTGQLKKLVGTCKRKALKRWIDDFLEESNEKLIVFVYHKENFKFLADAYGKVSCLGGKSGPERQKQVDLFQSDPKRRLFIGSLTADAEAITLTASSTVMFAELGWTPKEHDQCRDRARRIGQKKFVDVYYMLGKGTIDEHIYNIIQEKRKVIEQIVDGKVIDGKTNDVHEIIQRLRTGKRP